MKFSYAAVVVVALLALVVAFVQHSRQQVAVEDNKPRSIEKRIELLDYGNVQYTSYLILRDTRNGREYLCVHGYGVCPMATE